MKKRVVNSKRNLAATIYDASNPILSRSSKLHRKRGYLCGSGGCPNCMMRVNDVPNVRICQVKAGGECEVETQNVTAFVDRLNIMTHLHRYISAGFQYRHLYSSGWKRKLFYLALKRASGLGEAPSSASLPKPKRVQLEPEVMIVGGGAAGLGAAIEASKEHDRILLVDSRVTLGGEHSARWTGSKLAEVSEETEKLNQLVSQVKQSSKITVLTGTTIIGYYRLDDLAIGTSEDSTYEIRAKRALVATGSHEVLPMFVNNDSPRVMLSSAMQILANSGAGLPPDSLVVDLNGLGPLVSADLESRGIRVKGVTRPAEFDGREEELCERHGVKTLARSLIRKVYDDGRVDVLVASRVEKIKAGVVVVCGKYSPNYELPAQMGCNVMFELAGKRWSMKKNFHDPPVEATVAGSLTGRTYFEECRSDGAEAIGTPSQDRSVNVNLDPDPYLRRAYSEGGLETFVCLCEDISMAEVRGAISGGYSQIETLKRFTGAVTGPCQGKQCALTVATILAMEDGGEKAASYLTTVRQPIQSVPFAQLAAE
jgi:sarcosine oxidase, subunit alpha